MGFLYEVGIQATTYFISFLAGIFLVDLISGGFIRTYMRVRSSFGKLVLVRVKTRLRDYYRAGKVTEGWLVFTGLDKQARRYGIPEGKECFTRVLNVDELRVDEESGKVQTVSYSMENGNDPVKLEDLYTRALYRPSAQAGKKAAIMIVLLIALIAGVGFMIYIQYQTGTQVVDLTGAIDKLVSLVNVEAVV